MNASTKRKALMVLQVVAALVVVGYVLLGLRRQVPVPDLVVLGGIALRMYSLVMIITIITVMFYARSLLRSVKELHQVDIWEVLLYVLIPGIVGARAYHVVTEWYLYADAPGQVAALWTGGLSIVGGIVGGAAGLAVFARRRKLPLVSLVTIAALVLPVAQIMGRLGNFFNRELYGLPTQAPWGMYIEPQYRYFIFRNEEYYHPLFLYEMVANAILWLLLVHLWRSPELRKHLVKVYLAGYAGIRYILDFGRIELKPAWGLSYTQLVILAVLAGIIVFGVVYQLWYKRRYGYWFTK